MHLVLLPMALAAHVGHWIDTHVLHPFLIGTTAKQIVEEELGCYGVLAFLIFKTARLLVESWPLLQPQWLAGRIVRAIALGAALLGSAWLITGIYLGLLVPILDLQCSYGGLVLAPVVAWVALGYVLLADRVHEQRAELEAQAGEED